MKTHSEGIREVSKEEFQTRFGTRPSRTENATPYLYECFDDAEGREMAFIEWKAGTARYIVRDHPSPAS